MRKVGYSVGVCLLCSLLLVGCESTGSDNSPASAGEDSTTVSTTARSALLSGPEDTSMAPPHGATTFVGTSTSSSATQAVENDNGFDLFGTTATKTDVSIGSTTSTGAFVTTSTTLVSSTENSIITSRDNGTTTSAVSGGTTLSPYDDENNWVDGLIPTRK